MEGQHRGQGGAAQGRDPVPRRPRVQDAKQSPQATEAVPEVRRGAELVPAVPHPRQPQAPRHATAPPRPLPRQEASRATSGECRGGGAVDFPHAAAAQPARPCPSHRPQITRHPCYSCPPAPPAAPTAAAATPSQQRGATTDASCTGPAPVHHAQLRQAARAAARRQHDQRQQVPLRLREPAGDHRPPERGGESNRISTPSPTPLYSDFISISARRRRSPSESSPSSGSSTSSRSCGSTSAARAWLVCRSVCSCCWPR